MKKVQAWKARGINTPLETDIRRAYAWELLSVINTDNSRGELLSFTAALAIIDSCDSVLNTLKEYKNNNDS